MKTTRRAWRDYEDASNAHKYLRRVARDRRRNCQHDAREGRDATAANDACEQAHRELEESANKLAQAIITLTATIKHKHERHYHEERSPAAVSAPVPDRRGFLDGFRQLWRRS